MLERKIITALVSSIISIIVVTFGVFQAELNSFSLLILSVVSLLVIIGTFLYGFPSSMIASKIAEKYNGVKAIAISFFLHLFFGIIFVFVVGIIIDTKDMLNEFYYFWNSAEMFFLSSTLSSIIFWGVDETLRLKFGKEHKNYSSPNKVIFLNSNQK